MSANLIIGSSHSLYLAQAVGRFEATWQEASNALIAIEGAGGGGARLLFTTHRPSFIAFGPAAGGGIAASFGPLMDEIRAFNRTGSKVVFAIGGNEHNIRFLCANPRPFDFWHPSAPQIDPARQILPVREVRALLSAALERTLAVTAAIAGELPLAQRYYLAPPPPIPSEAQIRSNPAVFDFAAHGVEDALVRLKIYNLYVEIVRAFCEAKGIEFIPPVAQNRDDEGFLREAYWDGSTHATADYYRSVVSELGL